jgi:hypothetical protein
MNVTGLGLETISPTRYSRKLMRDQIEQKKLKRLDR